MSLAVQISITLGKSWKLYSFACDHQRQPRRSGGKRAKLNKKSPSWVIKSLLTIYTKQCNACAWSCNRVKQQPNENKIGFCF